MGPVALCTPASVDACNHGTLNPASVNPTMQSCPTPLLLGVCFVRADPEAPQGGAPMKADARGEA